MDRARVDRLILAIPFVPLQEQLPVLEDILNIRSGLRESAPRNRRLRRAARFRCHPFLDPAAGVVGASARRTLPRRRRAAPSGTRWRVMFSWGSKRSSSAGGQVDPRRHIAGRGGMSCITRARRPETSPSGRRGSRPPSPQARGAASTSNAPPPPRRGPTAEDAVTTSCFVGTRRPHEQASPAPRTPRGPRSRSTSSYGGSTFLQQRTPARLDRPHLLGEVKRFTVPKSLPTMRVSQRFAFARMNHASSESAEGARHRRHVRLARGERSRRFRAAPRSSRAAANQADSGSLRCSVHQPGRSRAALGLRGGEVWTLTCSRAATVVVGSAGVEGFEEPRTAAFRPRRRARRRRRRPPRRGSESIASSTSATKSLPMSTVA